MFVHEVCRDVFDCIGTKNFIINTQIIDISIKETFCMSYSLKLILPPRKFIGSSAIFCFALNLKSFCHVHKNMNHHNSHGNPSSISPTSIRTIHETINSWSLLS